MSYFTRQAKVTKISNEVVDSKIGVSIQAWGSNLDDINQIDGLANPGRVLMVDNTTGNIIASPLALGSAAYKNVGTNPGNVVIVEANGKIDPSLVDGGSASVPALWGQISIASRPGGVVEGDTVILPDEISEDLELLAGDGIKLTGGNGTLDKTIRIDAIHRDAWFNISDGTNTFSPTDPEDILQILGDGTNITATGNGVSKSVTLTYTGSQFKTVNADIGTLTAATPSDTLGIRGGDDVETTLAGGIININYTGKQWQTLEFSGFNYNLLGDTSPVDFTAQNRIDQLNIKAGFGITIETDLATKSLTIRSSDLERATAIEGLDGDVIDGGDYGEVYDGFTYDGGSYYAFDGGTY